MSRVSSDKPAENPSVRMPDLAKAGVGISRPSSNETRKELEFAYLGKPW